MRVLIRRLWKCWREVWDCDFDWSIGVDSHRWENKVEMFHRLSGGSDETGINSILQEPSK